MVAESGKETLSLACPHHFFLGPSSLGMAPPGKNSDSPTGDIPLDDSPIWLLVRWDTPGGAGGGEDHIEPGKKLRALVCFSTLSSKD